MSNEIRVFDPKRAQELEEEMNWPYNEEEGSACSGCGQVDGTQYKLTGYIVEDGGGGLYVEKTCQLCGTVNEEGDGEYYTERAQQM